MPSDISKGPPCLVARGLRLRGCRPLPLPIPSSSGGVLRLPPHRLPILPIDGRSSRNASTTLVMLQVAQFNGQHETTIDHTHEPSVHHRGPEPRDVHKGSQRVRRGFHDEAIGCHDREPCPTFRSRTVSLTARQPGGLRQHDDAGVIRERGNDSRCSGGHPCGSSRSRASNGDDTRANPPLQIRTAIDGP